MANSPETAPSRKMLQLLGLCALGIYYLLNQGDAYVRVAGALRGEDIDCSPIAESVSDHESYNSLVILGSGMHKNGDNWVLNTSYVLRVQAAAYLIIDQYRSGTPIARILLMDSASEDAESRYVARDVLISTVYELSGGEINLSQDLVETRDDEVDVTDSIQRLIEIDAKNSLGKTAIIAEDYFVDRTEMILCGTKPPLEQVSVLTVEEVLSVHNSELMLTVTERNNSPQIKDRERLERLKLFSFLVPMSEGGELLEWLKVTSNNNH